MSLLLNALKKAEEGEKSASEAEQTQAPQQAAQPSSPGQPQQPVQPVQQQAAQPTPVQPASAPAAQAAPLSPPPSPAPLKPAQPEQKAAQTAQTVDFDSIADEQIAPASGPAPAGDAPGKSRVDAARVFGASEAEGGGSSVFRKVVYPLLGVALVGGGGYFVLASGLIPGVNLDALLGFQKPPEQVVQSVAGVSADLEVADDVVLLPIPSVDVQSQVDFASLQGGGGSGLNDEEYVRRVAYLTGFDFNEERDRVVREQNQLIIDLNIVSEEEEFAAVQEFGDEENLSAEQAIGAPEIPFHDASDSRDTKFRLDSTTPSDRDANFIVGSAGVATPDEPEPEASAPDGAVLDGTVPDAPAPEAAPEAVAQASPVEVNVSQEGEKRQRLIEDARNLYRQGRYAEAEAIYRNVLAMLPTSRDALRGVAQIAVVTGRHQTAVATYLDLLGYYPNDPVAIAELANFRGDDGNFYEMEKALKNVLGKVPSADGRLYFSLGNLYAQNGNLGKAQQSYFDAFSRETNNPDYAYNLAVVLDHLNKPKLAMRYYKEAVRLSGSVPVGFNRAQVDARINDLNQ